MTQISISLCLGANLRSGGASFSPASLFASGEQGAWYEPGYGSFQDANATTPAGVGDPVGFQLGRSQGAGYSGGAFTGLGAEELTNGSFDADTDWTKGSGWTISGGRAIHTGAGSYINQGTPTPGAYYLIEVDVAVADGSNFVQVYLGNSPGSAPFTAPGVYKLVMPGLSGSQGFALRSVGDTQVNSFSVREIPGAHLTQATTSYKPSLQTGGLLFDGNDDRLTGAPKPTTSGTIAARFNGSTASRVIFGSQAASDGRCFLALDASGKIAAGIGAQGTSTIAGGADIRGAWHTAAVTWDGSTVTLYLDGVSVYSAAQSGAVNTTVAMMLGALNANGTAAAFWAGTVSDALVIDRVLTTDEITNLNTYWSA